MACSQKIIQSAASHCPNVNWCLYSKQIKIVQACFIFNLHFLKWKCSRSQVILVTLDHFVFLQASVSVTCNATYG